MNPAIALRGSVPADLPGLAQLFRATIHAVNRRDYTAAESEAWAPVQLDQARWRQQLATEEGIVAEWAGAITGFCSWTMDA